MIGLIIASFIDAGIRALVNDKFTIAVGVGVMVMYTSLNTKAGIGSRGHDFIGYSYIILMMIQFYHFNDVRFRDWGK